MDFNYARDEQRLLQRAGGVKRKVTQLKRIHDLSRVPEHASAQKNLFTAKEWLISPRRLATAESTGLCRHLCALLEKKEPSDPALDLLLELIDDVPSEECQKIIGAHEHNMMVGQYDAIVRDTTKFDAQLKRLLADPEYHRCLKRLDELFDLKSREAFNGLIVSEAGSEQTNGPDEFDWSDDKARFARVFSAFCRRFNLYGLEFGKPLLLKVKVQPTPVGITVHYPKWMSMDVWRDLSHNEIMKLHKAYGADRQGAKLSAGQLEKQELALRVLQAEELCQRAGRVGVERQKFIIKKAGLPPGTSDRAIRKLLELGRKLRANHKEPAPTVKPGTQSADDPNRHVKMARARADYLALSPEGQEEFRKWIGAVSA